MKKVLSLLIILTVLASASLTMASEEEKKELSLKDAIYLALKNNLDLQVQQTTTQGSFYSLRAANTIFIPSLDFSLNMSDTNSPSGDIFSGGGSDISESNNETMTLTVNQNTPLNGNISLVLNTSNTDSNSPYTIANPYISSFARLIFTQPLLKNFGNLPQTYQIRIAANNYKKSKFQLEETVANTIYNVESAYWNLVLAHKSLEVSKMALVRAKDWLKQNEIKRKVGTIAPIEVLSSKASAARNESAVIQAERNVQSAEESLKQILNMSNEFVTLVPTDEPVEKNIDADYIAFLDEALENRPDIKQAKLSLENQNIEVKYQKNQSLPSLDLVARYWTTGRGGKVFIYEPGSDPLDPDRQPIDVLEKDMLESFDEVFSFLYKNWSINLSLKIPLGFKKEKALLAQARVNMKRTLLELKKTENTIVYEVKDVIKELESNIKLADADRVALELQGENLKAEEKKLAVGIGTNYEVLDAQERYANAENSALSSKIGYIMTLSKINKILNRSFKVYNVNIADILDKKK